ncbi:hypothetical protein AVEN_211577-1 [Araneus ventricosus]|uniref:Uncharacterized protein n=1 Tax=Araneus ventricosus TaxID=182803 RepID=A0A4Y2D8G2_ARAVE|nr:hypothetical protein AVEN_211577-1 [Araneus ventricosus]
MRPFSLIKRSNFEQLSSVCEVLDRLLFISRSSFKSVHSSLNFYNKDRLLFGLERSAHKQSAICDEFRSINSFGLQNSNNCTYLKLCIFCTRWCGAEVWRWGARSGVVLVI